MLYVWLTTSHNIMFTKDKKIYLPKNILEYKTICFYKIEGGMNVFDWFKQQAGFLFTK